MQQLYLIVSLAIFGLTVQADQQCNGQGKNLLAKWYCKLMTVNPRKLFWKQYYNDGHIFEVKNILATKL